MKSLTSPRVPAPSSPEATPSAPAPRSDAERRLFARALRETWSVWGGRVLTAFDLSAFQRICDLGGEGGGVCDRWGVGLEPGRKRQEVMS